MKRERERDEERERERERERGGGGALYACITHSTKHARREVEKETARKTNILGRLRFNRRQTY